MRGGGAYAELQRRCAVQQKPKGSPARKLFKALTDQKSDGGTTGSRSTGRPPKHHGGTVVGPTLGADLGGNGQRRSGTFNRRCFKGKTEAARSFFGCLSAGGHPLDGRKDTGDSGHSSH